MGSKPVVVVVDDDSSIRARLGTAFGPRAEVVAFAWAKEALAWIGGATRLDGGIVDLGLPDGSGYEITRLARQRFVDADLMVLTGRYDPRSINRVQLLRAQYVLKPDFDDNVRAFTQALTTRLSGQDSARVDPKAVAQELAAKHGLTRRELAALELSVDGVPRSHLPDAMGVSENTVKTQIRSLLAKCAAPTLAELIWRVRTTRGEAEAPPRSQ